MKDNQILNLSNSLISICHIYQAIINDMSGLLTIIHEGLDSTQEDNRFLKTGIEKTMESCRTNLIKVNEMIDKIKEDYIKQRGIDPTVYEKITKH